MSLLLGALLLPSVVTAVNNGLAVTPQMGWNNWNSLGCDVSESLLLDTSKVLLSTGLRDVGYNYVVLDDCWSAGRDKKGYLQHDSTKFPHGMKWVAGSLHDQGLLFGMYSSAGEFTCARYEGSLDHEEKDAERWASWDVDYLKYDNCYHRGRFGFPEVSFNRYNRMAQALNSTGRPILYSLCTWGEDYVHTWGMSIANSWRISGDIYDHFNRPDALCACDDPRNPHCIAPGTHCSVLNIINKVTPYVDRAQIGGWNDLDCLEVGMGGMSDDEYKAHFTMWSILKSPLLIGTDIRKLDAKALSILNNPAIIALNQDPVGRTASQIYRSLDVKKDKYGQGEIQIWSGPLWPNDQVVVFLNAADEDLDMSATLAEIFVHEGPEGSAPQTKEEFHVHDLWAERMSDSDADSILKTSADASTKGTLKTWYNATQTPYKEGLANGDERLYGQKIGSIGPKSKTTVLKAKVPRHGVKAFRLKNKDSSAKRYQTTKDEL